MLDIIKRYELNGNIKEEDLKLSGFKLNGWMPSINEPKMSYTRVLVDDIELHIEIPLIDGKALNFDDYKNIYVIDDNYGQPYTPFYTSDNLFPYLKKVILRYNEEMDKLVSKGILKNLTLEEKVEKVKKYK